MAKDADGVVELMAVQTAFEAEVIANTLVAEGIWARSMTIAGSIVPAPSKRGSFPVVVRRADLEAARERLRSQREESIGIDWNDVDTGDKSPLTPEELRGPDTRCATCQYDLKGLARPELCPECGTRFADVSTRETYRTRGAWQAWHVRALVFGVIVIALLIFTLDQIVPLVP